MKQFTLELMLHKSGGLDPLNKLKSFLPCWMMDEGLLLSYFTGSHLGRVMLLFIVIHYIEKFHI